LVENRKGRKVPILGTEWNRPIANREAKEAIAQKVAALASAGDVIGIGSGSTSFLTVLALGQRVTTEGLPIRAVPTSIEIELACQAVGLDVTHSFPTRIDWCFDGADEVDPAGRLIKGRGGAIYRERLVFFTANRRVVIADASKTVTRLGQKFPVPVEVEPSWVRIAYDRLWELDHVVDVILRMGVAKDGPVLTEAGRLLFDVRMTEIDDTDEARILAIPGVCCTGVFSGFDFSRVEH
jgi:ribose 5-phosphate isomerase A